MSGNSHQRKVLKAAVREAVQKQLAANPTPTAQAPRSPKSGSLHKLSELWASNPVWAIIGVFLGMIATQIPLKIIYVLVWAVIAGEFVRVRISEQRTFRYSANFFFSFVIALCLIWVWRIVPKPKQLPTLDEQANTVVNALLSKWHMNQQITNIYQNISPSNTATLDFGFLDSTGDTLKKELLIAPDHVALGYSSLLSNVFKVSSITVRTVGSTPAKNVHISIRLCPACTWTEDPTGWNIAEYGSAFITQRDRSVGDLKVNTVLKLPAIKFAAPIQLKSADISIAYTCNNCPPAGDIQQTALHVKFDSPK